MKTSSKYLYIILSFSVISSIVFISYNHQKINLGNKTEPDPIQIGIIESFPISQPLQVQPKTTINNQIDITPIQQIKNEITFVPKISKPLSQPTFIIVASINAGTSTLNRILMYNFKHFFHKFRHLEDMYYFIGCTPLEYHQYIENQHNRNINTSFKSIYNSMRNTSNAIGFYSWNTSFNNLISRGCKDSENNNSYHCNIKCRHNDYMDHIGYNRQPNTIRFSDHFFENLKDIQNTQQYNQYPNERNDEIYFYWDRTSGYNSLPYIPVILATNYPHSKLLYVIREPILQIYSHFRLFNGTNYLQKPKNQRFMTEFEANARFNKLLQFIESDMYSVLIRLLNEENQSNEIEDNIIAWYISIWAKKTIQWKEKRIFDVCPYVNVLLFIKAQQFYNRNNFKNNHFKLIQFEWEINNLLLTAIYIYCWTVFDESKFNNKCIKYYTVNEYENIHDILFNYHTLDKTHNNYGKLNKYNWTFTNITTFDKLVNFQNICDTRLLQLIQKYPWLVLGQFEYDKWTQRRSDIKQEILSKRNYN